MRFRMKFVKRRGITKVLAVIVLLVFISVMLPLGILVVDKINNAMPTPSNTQLASAQNNTISNVATAFDIASIIPLVAIAGLIISILVAYFYLRRGGG